jgi:carboxypeptidase T
MLTSRRTAATVAAAACLILLPSAQPIWATQEAPPAPAQPESAADRAVYSVPNTDARARTAINRTGAQVLSAVKGVATIEATTAQADALRKAGFVLENRSSLADALKRITGPNRVPGDFPPDDRGYHNYDETVAELDGAAKDHPDIAAKSSVGKSFEGRDIPMLKISDNAGQDENEPEVLFNCNQHAREHLTTEMCLRIVNRFTDNYANDPAIKNVVDNREIWVIPTVNPDGSAYDVATGQYQMWRKNRQDAGTDTNRNWGHQWGCCGGSSGDPNDETYHGSGPFSAPETKVVSDFVNSRSVGGTQQIKANIDFHTYSELVMWPYGYTHDRTAPGMSQQEYDRFVKVGTDMAKTNGYKPQQSSELYITDGDITDWMWGQHKILAFAFEMYPGEGGADGFYPPDEVIERETARNDAAVDILLREVGA